MDKKIVLIDGHSILNRAFYGVPDLTNAQGLHTNAVYGFLNILFKFLDEEKPDFLAVAFDVKAPTFRHKIYEAYKGTRKPMPEELRQQVPVMKEVLAAMGICILECPGLEADDILGTLAKRAQAEGMQVSLVSGDRDLLQVATEKIKIRIPKTKGGRTEVEDYYAGDVEAAYGVSPLAFIDMKALMGDTSDNIPGVPKVGEKTASELIRQYKTLDGIYENLEQITKKSIRESLASNKEIAYLSQTLATINVDSPIDFSWEKASVGNFFTQEAYQMFQKLEFKNMLGRFDQSAVTKSSRSQQFVMTSDLGVAEQVFARAKAAEHVGFYILTDKEASDMTALALCFSEEDIVILTAEGFLTAGYLCDRLAGLYQSGQSLSTFHIKKAYEALLGNGDSENRKAGCGTEKLFDILIAAYLLNPLKNDYAIEDIANEHLGLMVRGRAQLFAKLSWNEAAEQKAEELKEYAGWAAYVCFSAGKVLEEKLQQEGMATLFYEMEMPLSRVLYDMEK